jgi:LysR family transcriptional regulator, hydrogen peroxide-inducible genes activator
MSNISLKQLRYFDALAQSLHFGRAAEICAVTQPALSMQIQDLEKELGTVLVERTRQGAKLTAQGEEVARRAASILAAVQDLTDFTQHGGQVLTGTLHLGVIPTIAPYVLPKILPHLRRSYPGLDLHLREAQTRYVLAELAIGGLDAVLLSLPAGEPEFETLELFDDTFVLAVPGGRRVPAQAIATPDLFENDRLLLLEEGHCLRDQALSFCGMKQVQNLNTFGTTSLSTLVQMVANGFGVTLLPKMSLETEAARGDVQLLAFAPPEPSRKIGLVWRRSSPRKRDFMELAPLIVRAAGNAKAKPVRKGA